jgi:NitT/TauT family transport system substrate-binding protein
MHALRVSALSLALSAAVVFGFAGQTRAAATIKVGMLKVTAAGPIMIAQDKGYFAQEGISAELVFANSPQIISQGVMAGDLDFGLTAPTAGFLNTAAQGAMRIIAGDIDEAPGFVGDVVVVSNRAYAAGLTTIDKLAGHSLGIAGAGTPQQYMLAALARKHGFDYASVRLVILGSYPNAVSAVVGGTADSAIVPMSPAREAIVQSKLQLLATVSDEMRMAISAVITSGKTADERSALVERFLRAYRTGARYYHAAFTGPDEQPLDSPAAPAIYALMAKYTDVPIETMKLGIAHVDAEGRLDIDDLRRQIEWYKSQGMLKPDVDTSKIIDMRYVVPRAKQ